MASTSSAACIKQQGINTNAHRCESGIALEVETPHILGKERETYEFAYERIMHIRLL
ncbi:hypothetical protein BH23ACT11_BH23ACT11_18180 [soil metagenome]